MGNEKKIGADEVRSAIERIASAIAERHGQAPGLVLLGIARGGIALAERIAEILREKLGEREIPQGIIDISFHRDDIGRKPIPKEYPPTSVPLDASGATVILIDDVLCSGRTVKAALNELFDHGRPRKVELAVLVDRGGRRLPIAPDYCGMTLSAAPEELVSVNLGPEGGADSIVVTTGQT